MPASSTAILRVLQPAQDGVERRRGHRRIDAAQHVVGAEFEDHRLGAVRHRPVEPGEPAGGGVAGHAGIGDLDGNALGLERAASLAGNAASAGRP